MSRQHRTNIRRTFGNGMNMPAILIRTQCCHAWETDHYALGRMNDVVTMHNMKATRVKRPYFVLDLGGSVMDVDTHVVVYAAGYRFKMWEHHLGDYLHKLENMHPAEDAPHLVVLGGRWIRVVVGIPTAVALRDALRPLRVEMARKVQQRDQEFARRMEDVAARVAARGAGIVMAPAQQVDP